MVRAEAGASAGTGALAGRATSGASGGRATLEASGASGGTGASAGMGASGVAVGPILLVDRDDGAVLGPLSLGLLGVKVKGGKWASSAG